MDNLQINYPAKFLCEIKILKQYHYGFEKVTKSKKWNVSHWIYGTKQNVVKNIHVIPIEQKYWTLAALLNTGL